MAEWYYMAQGQQQGPVRGSQLKAMAASGALNPDDLVWEQSMTDWVAASRMRGLVFAAATAPKIAPAPSVPAPAQEWTNFETEQQHDQQPEQVAEHFQPAPAEYAPAPHVTAATLNYQQDSPGIASERTVEMLRRTRPWVLLISIFTFIIMGLMGLSTLFTLGSLAFGTVSRSRAMGAPGLFVGAFAGVFMTICMLIILALLFFPALFLLKYASAIKRLVASRRVKDLEDAMQAQKNYWVFIGILMAIVIGFYAIGLIAMFAGMALR